MHEKCRTKRELIYITTILTVFLLISSVSAAPPYFVTTDLGGTYTYQGTSVRYIKAVDVTNTAVTEMTIVSGANTKTIGSPTIGSVQRIFSSTTGTTKGVTITVTGGADTTVNYNKALNDYVYTQIGTAPSLYSLIPDTTTEGTEGVFLLSRANDSAKKGDIQDQSDLVLLQEASYIYVVAPDNRAILYKSVNPAQQGSISEGAIPFYNENNFGQTITSPANNVSLNGYTSLGAAQGSVTAGKYSAVALSYDGTNTFSIWGYVPAVILDGDRTITWRGASVPASYTKETGDVALSLNTQTGITNISYLFINTGATYNAKVTVDTSKLADHITTQWDSLGGTAPVMSNVLNKIILDGVGTGANDPYTYAIKKDTASAYPDYATEWSSIAITPGYGISGYADSSSVTVTNAALKSLLAGNYYVYVFATDADLTPLAYDRQTISIVNAPSPTPTSSNGGGGGGGGGGGSPAGSIVPGGEVVVSTTTGTLSTDVSGVVQESVEIDSADEQASLMIGSGTVALDANNQPLTDVTIQAIAPSSAPDAPTSQNAPEGTVFTFNDMYYQCEPTGAQFDPPADLVFQLTEEEYNALGPNQEFSVQYFDVATGNWVEVTTYVNPNTYQVIAEVSHFSIFALMVKESTGIQATATPMMTTTTESTTAVPTGGGTPIWTWAVIIVIIIAIIGTVWWYYNNKNR